MGEEQDRRTAPPDAREILDKAGAKSDALLDQFETEANHIDLIAMCTHGRTGLARWTLGSVADRVLRAGSTPILLVRGR
jgi:nucleotide-binding universal stress UspA family protein